MVMEDIKQKPHTLVIGGTRGIGRAVVRTMAAADHVVSVIGRSAPSESDRNIPGVRHWLVDLLAVEELATTCSEIIREHGQVNHLVFLQRYRGKNDGWVGDIETSLTATKNVIEWMEGKFADSIQNSIVIVSSIASQFIADEQPLSYHVAKAGLNQMVRYYAVTLGAQRIRVNSISPGTVIKDESTNYYRENTRLSELYKRIIPLGRMGTSDDVAGVVAFLCSPQSSFISGQNIVLDGGVSLIGQEALARALASPDISVVATSGPEHPPEHSNE